jgi:cob(I)alamin adenosyltransferase
MAALLLKPYLVIDTARLERMPARREWRRKEVQEVRRLLNRAEKALAGDLDILILYGVIELVNAGVVAVEDLMTLIRLKPEHVELVLTGSGAGENLIDRADLVTEMVISLKKDKPDMDDDTHLEAPSEVVTGNGKGKTTYSLGRAMLMSCTGVRSTFLQFIKSPRDYGEVMAIQRLPYLDIKTMGEGFLHKHGFAAEARHRQAAKWAWESCLREIFSLQYGLIVLDEINIATYYGLVNAGRVRELLFLKPQDLHLILSGRNAHLEVREGASSVIEMREIKHPFKKGIKARKGIEY